MSLKLTTETYINARNFVRLSNPGNIGAEYHDNNI